MVVEYEAVMEAGSGSSDSGGGGGRDDGVRVWVQPGRAIRDQSAGQVQRHPCSEGEGGESEVRANVPHLHLVRCDIRCCAGARQWKATARDQFVHFLV